MLLGRARGRNEQDVATRPIAGPARRFFADFVCALALAGWEDRGGRVGRGRRPGFDRGGLGLADRGRLWLGVRRVLASAAAIASGLVAAALLAMGGGPVPLRGVPAPPALRGPSAGEATVAGLGPTRQEPAFTPFEQAAPAARMAAVTAGRTAERLTPRRRAARLSQAHGRDDSRALRRRGGDAPRRPLAPTGDQPDVSDRAPHPAQGTGAGSGVPCPHGRDRNEPKLRSASRAVAQLALRKWPTSWPRLTGGA